MKLWRLTRADRTELNGAGATLFGARYSSPGRPIVHFASEAGLAVLITLRYLEPTRQAFDQEYLLGWVESTAPIERVPTEFSAEEKTRYVDKWAASERSLLAAIQSAVLPEADVILMNPLHPEAVHIAPLAGRPFRFAECLHRPPMLDRFA